MPLRQPLLTHLGHRLSGPLGPVQHALRAANRQELCVAMACLPGSLLRLRLVLGQVLRDLNQSFGATLVSLDGPRPRLLRKKRCKWKTTGKSSTLDKASE